MNAKEYRKKYMHDYLIRYTFKLNARTESPGFLTLWGLVKNKSACIRWCLQRSMQDYLKSQQGMTQEEVSNALMNPTDWEAKQKQLRAQKIH